MDELWNEWGILWGLHGTFYDSASSFLFNGSCIDSYGRASTTFVCA